MQFYTTILLLLAATGAIASPLEAREQKPDGIVIGSAQFAKDPIGSGKQGDAAAPVPVVNGTGVETRDLETRANYNWVQWANSITFSGVPVSGDYTITMWSNGYAEFRSHFHDSGFWSYDVSLTCALKDRAGRAYTFSRSGRMYGTIEPGSRDTNGDATKYNAAIQQHWVDIENGDLLMHCNAHASGTISFSTILGAVAGIIAIF
jgi:hypothetical protein